MSLDASVAAAQEVGIFKLQFARLLYSDERLDLNWIPMASSEMIRMLRGGPAETSLVIACLLLPHCTITALTLVISLVNFCNTTPLCRESGVHIWTGEQGNLSSVPVAPIR